MSKNTLKKSNIKSNRLYFISNDDDDYKKIDEYFKSNKPPFIDKIFKTKSTAKDIINTFINIKLNTELNEEGFKKLSEKFNSIINKKYKMFYIDNNNKFVYIHDDIINDINESFRLFIQDD